jgi:large subunit ribosomal protein L6
MSRIGKAPITVPSGVEVTVNSDNYTTVKGPKGTLEQKLPAGMIIEIKDGIITVKRPNDDKENRAMHGLTRTLLNNMVIGVTEQFKKTLELTGVGYRAMKNGKTLTLTVGKSHPVTFEENADVTIDVPSQNTIIITGCNKQKVGEFAANVRGARPAEPYKGKGLRYEGERIKRKVGKAGKK